MPDELTARALDDRPQAVAPQVPMAHVPRQLLPGVGPRERSCPDVARHVRVGADPGMRLEIVGPKAAKLQPVGQELGNEAALRFGQS
jgi:hypothetical protein